MPPVGADPADVDVRPLDHRPASLRQVSAPAALAAVSALSLPRIKSFFFFFFEKKESALPVSEKHHEVFLFKCFSIKLLKFSSF